MDVISKFLNYVENFSSDESVAALLREKMKNPLMELPRTKDYFIVTELCNPAQAYWSTVRPDIVKSPELRRKLAKGRRLQTYASVWFRSLPNFIVEEGKLDGAWVELRGVRESIDYRIGDSIFELKTKDSLPESPDEIFSLYPHDLEQLIFYTLIHPSHPVDNFLVFMKNSEPFKLMAFKIKINDFNKLKNLLILRMNELKSAINDKNPTKLGKCRYHNNHCQFLENNICACNEIVHIPMDKIKSAIEINFDENFTKELENAKDSCKIRTYHPVRDILAPRQFYMEKIEGIENEYIPSPEKQDYEACLWSSVNSLPISLSPVIKQKIVKSHKEDRLHTGFKWAKLKSSVHPDDEIVPYLLKVSDVSDKKFTKKPSNYFLAELGITCAAFGKNKGIIFVLYPKLDKFVQVFQVIYRDIDNLLKDVKEIIADLEKAENTKDILSLPPCPEFMNYDRKCPMTKICHSKVGSGCIPNLYIKPE